jgi:hypothetical protein
MLLGALLVLCASMVRGHRLVGRATGVVAGLASIGLVVAVALFAFDAIETRRQIVGARVRAFDVVIVKTVSVLLLSAVFAGFMAWAGFNVRKRQVVKRGAVDKQSTIVAAGQRSSSRGSPASVS